MLCGVTVDNMVIGGPAYSSDLKIGDIILAVDGNPISADNAVEALVGNDRPGSKVTLSVKSLGADATKTVPLTRMVVEVIADRRQMFELFTTLKARMNSSKKCIL